MSIKPVSERIKLSKLFTDGDPFTLSDMVGRIHQPANDVRKALNRLVYYNDLITFIHDNTRMYQAKRLLNPWIMKPIATYSPPSLLPAESTSSTIFIRPPDISARLFSRSRIAEPPSRIGSSRKPPTSGSRSKTPSRYKRKNYNV